MKEIAKESFPQNQWEITKIGPTKKSSWITLFNLANTFEDAPQNVKKTLDAVKSGKTAIYTALNPNSRTIVGFAVLLTDPENAKSGRISSVYTDDSHRRSGVLTSILSVLQNDYDKLTLLDYTHATMGPAAADKIRRSYYRMGFYLSGVKSGGMYELIWNRQ
jgi:hypothetical protein